MVKKLDILIWGKGDAMLQLWEHYVKVFRKLITDGWQVYRTTGSTLYTWVYPFTSLPTKFRLKEAYEINNRASVYSRVFATTRAIDYSFSVSYDTREFLAGKWVS